MYKVLFLKLRRHFCKVFDVLCESCSNSGRIHILKKRMRQFTYNLIVYRRLDTCLRIDTVTVDCASSRRIYF